MNIRIKLLIMDRPDGRGECSKGGPSAKSADGRETKTLVECEEKLTATNSQNQCHYVQVISSIASWTIHAFECVLKLVDYLPDAGAIV